MNTPVKMVQLVRPAVGIGPQEFHDHWRHPHGTLGKDIRVIRHYVQNHRTASAAFDDSDAPYQGIVEIWLDNAGGQRNLGADPQYLEYLRPDEPVFIDTSDVRTTVTVEDVVQARRVEVDEKVDEADRYWSDKDAATYVTLWQFVADRSVTEDHDEALELSRRLGAFRQVINRSVRDDSEFAFVRQVYWPTLTVFERAVAADPEAFAALRDASSVLFLAQSEPAF